MSASRSSEPDRLLAALRSVETLKRVGRVAEARGTLIRATGVNARIGDVCELRDPGSRQLLMAEVVGIERGMALLTPLGTLDGLSADTEVVSKGFQATVGAGDGLLGRTLDALGNVVDGQPAPTNLTGVPVYRDAPNAMTRIPIRQPFHTGVRALDTVLTVGEGQRVGIFAAAGGGKSTLLGMLARSAADVNVIVLLGERGREVREFIDDNLGAEGLRKSIVVVATSDRPALERGRAAYVGTAIAEYFRDQGKRVLLLLDSVTRFARALRDVGLAVGEPPARRGYPPSVFSALPRLFERTGNNERGSITAFYAVLLEDEEGDPIGEEVRSILDGHIYLSRKLAAANHFPAIDVLASASRVMPRVAQPAHLRAAASLRKQLAKYQDVELLLQIGEYKRGSDAEADEAIRNIPAIRKLLQQPADQLSGFDESVVALTGIGK
jgi:type III secretion protein N (ATPase)